MRSLEESHSWTQKVDGGRARGLGKGGKGAWFNGDRISALQDEKSLEVGTVVMTAQQCAYHRTGDVNVVKTAFCCVYLHNL